MSPALSISLFQAAVYAGGGVANAFLPLWLVQCGLTPAGVGQAFGLASLIRISAVPVWGELADRIGRIRPVLAIAAGLTGAATLAFVPAYGFLAVLAVATVQGFAANALTPLIDTLSLALAQEGRLHYGRVRASGSAVYMAAAVGAGPIVAAVGTIAAPLLMGASYVIAAALSVLLPPRATRVRPPTTLGSFRLLRNRAFVLTLIASALIQSSNAGYYALASLHWRSHGIGDTTIGLLWAEGVLTETIMFIFARPLTARLGPGGLTALAGAGSLVRWSVVALTTDPLALAAVQWLHCASYGLQFLSAMAILTRHIAPERAATAQTLHAALGMTASTGLAMWVAGLVYDGSGTVFLLMAALGGAGMLVAPALRRIDRK